MILRYCTNSIFDALRLFELSLFCFLTGNADMHLKNFSLLREKDVALSPAYDLLPTALLLPEDREETALAINGRKRKLGRQDMLKLGKSLRLTERQSTNALRRFEEKLPAALRLIASGFCGEDQKLRYEALIRERSERLLG